jgi:iron-sulfur cluster assembly protein
LLDFAWISSYISIMAIMVSDKASGQLSTILAEQGKPGACLRVWVAGLGCSGYRYGMGIDEKEPEKGDQIFESNGIRILVDAQSLSYMDGSLVNWVEEPENSGFAIDNPNPDPAKECDCAGGCGMSAEAKGVGSKGSEERLS